MSYYIPDLRVQQRGNFRFSLFHKKKEMKGQQPWQVLRGRIIAFNIVTPMAIWFCEYLCPQNPLQRHSRFAHLFYRGWVESITLGFFFFNFYVWIPTLNIWKIRQHSQKGPVKLKSWEKSLSGRSWSIRATLYTLSKLCKTTWVSDNYHQGKLYSLSCHITINQAAIIIIYLAKPLSRQFAICSWEIR